MASKLIMLLLLCAAPAMAQTPDTLRAPADNIIAFGWTTETTDDYLLVGAWDTTPSSSPNAQSDPRGIVFVYKQGENEEWILDGTLESDRMGDQDCFSWALDILDDVVAVGAECEYEPDTDTQGAVYLYRRSGAGWLREDKITPADVPAPTHETSRFGQTVALGEGFLLAGSGGHPIGDPDEFNDGIAFEFASVGGSWEYSETIKNEDTPALYNEGFGQALTVRGDRALIGAPLSDVDGFSAAGATYAFHRDGNGWVQDDRIVSPNPESHGFFGLLVELEDSFGLVSSFERRIYIVEQTGADWSVRNELDVGNSYFKSAASSSGHLLTVTEDDWKLFSDQDGQWTESPISSTPYTYWRDELASVSDRHAVVGHSEPDDQGYVLVFDLASVVAVDPAPPLVEAFRVEVAPNPVSRESEIAIHVKDPSEISISVFDVRGREVAVLANRRFAPGRHTIRFDSSALPSGGYFLRLASGDHIKTRVFTVAH